MVFNIQNSSVLNSKFLAATGHWVAGGWLGDPELVHRSNCKRDGARMSVEKTGFCCLSIDPIGIEGL